MSHQSHLCLLPPCTLVAKPLSQRFAESSGPLVSQSEGNALPLPSQHHPGGPTASPRSYFHSWWQCWLMAWLDTRSQPDIAPDDVCTKLHGELHGRNPPQSTWQIKNMSGKKRLEEAGTVEDTCTPSAWSLGSFIILSKGPKVNKLKVSQGPTALTAKYGQGKGPIAKQTQQWDAISSKQRTSLQPEVEEAAKLSQEEEHSWKQLFYVSYRVSRRFTKRWQLTGGYLRERLSPCACSRKWKGKSGGWWSSGCGHPVSSAAQRTGLCRPALSPRSRSTVPGPPERRRARWGQPAHAIPPLRGTWREGIAGGGCKEVH